MLVAYLVIRMLSFVGLLVFEVLFCSGGFSCSCFFLFLVGSKFTLQVNNSGDKQHHSNESHHPTRQLFAFQVLHSLSCESQ